MLKYLARRIFHVGSGIMLLSISMVVELGKVGNVSWL